MDLDGWLLFDFHGVNPVTVGMIALEGMVTRRIFVYVPRRGMPTAITHAIEQGPWRRWPESWGRVVYSGWRELEAALATLVRGHRIAMEYSPGDAVPYVDRVPAGVIEMVRQAGAVVVSSGELREPVSCGLSNAADAAARRRAAEASPHDRPRRRVRREMSERAHGGAARRSPSWSVPGWIALGVRARRDGLRSMVPSWRWARCRGIPTMGQRRDARPWMERGNLLLMKLSAREPGHPYARAEERRWASSGRRSASGTGGVWATMPGHTRDAAMRRPARASRRPDGRCTARTSSDAARERRSGGWPAQGGLSRVEDRPLHGSARTSRPITARTSTTWRPGRARMIPGVGFSIEPGIYIPDALGSTPE